MLAKVIFRSLKIRPLNTVIEEGVWTAFKGFRAGADNLNCDELQLNRCGSLCPSKYIFGNARLSKSQGLGLTLII